MNTNETQPKIALIRSSYSPYGGVERTALSIIKGLLDANVKVSLLTWPYQSWPVIHKNFEVVQLGSHRGSRFWKAWLFNRAVSKYLLNNPFDRIFSLDRVSQFTHLHAGGGTHKTFLKIKNENSSVTSRIFRKASPFHAYTLYLEKKGFANPKLQRIRCNSNLVKDDIYQNYHMDQKKLQVIYSSIDWTGIGTVFAQRNVIAGDLYKQHNINPEWNCLLFLGSGFSRKGLDIAIEGLSFLPQSYHLLIVGNGSERLYLHQASKLGLFTRVHFLGAQEKGWRYASICKALVLPSRYDPFGGAAAEGHAMGIPVLVSDKTGYADWVLPGKSGIILKSPITKDSIKNAFNELLQLIEIPKMTPQQIREHNKNLDNKIISAILIREFLEI